MFRQYFLFFNLSLSLTAFAAPTPALPACSTDVSVQPCACHGGIVFQNSTSVGIIGASVFDARDILYSFFNTSYLGVLPINVTGKDDRVGSTRTLPLGNETFTEVIFDIDSHQDGSFYLQSGLKDFPLIYHESMGTQIFYGYWDNLYVKPINDRETSVYWQTYGCINFYAGFREFQVNAIKNATAILQSRGQIIGINAGPNSTVYPIVYSTQ